MKILLTGFEAFGTVADNPSQRIVEHFAAQQQATARLTAALDTSKAESELLTRRLAIADDLLRDRPKTDRCRVLWFDCPSRTTTFVAGAVLGAVGGVYVASR